ncbi:MAG: terminase large subunit [Sulfuricaulis sp.]|nr:terminase large subunit [Sulfuricaulis sp.]
MAWNLSCPQWEVKLRAGKSLIPDLPLNKAAGDRAVAIFDKLRLADVPGTPYLAEACGDWFRECVRALFGSLDPVTRARLIRELFVLVSKKNSKTTYGALMMLTAELLNERPNAPFIMTAPVHDVAELAFSAAAGAIALDPVLSKKLHVREHLKTIVHRESGAALQIMTFDPATLTGQKCAGVLIDELHVVAKMNKAASAIRQLRGGMLPFPEAFMAFITTQSEEAPSGVFKAELQKARAIRDGTREGAMLPVLYEFPQAMQKDAAVWRNPKNWHMVTPNAGRSVTVERLKEEFDVAQATSEEELRSWASQHLNVEIGLALHSDRWAGADYWEQQARPAFTLDELIALCEVIEIGIDGGGLDDLLGFAVLGRHAATHEWMLWTHAWAHPSVLERRKSEAERFRDFARDGNLTLVEQIGEDVAEVAGIAFHVEQSGKLDKIGVDQAGIGAILDALVDAGVPQRGIDHQGKEYDKIVGIPQGWRMNGAIKTAERRLAEGGMIHGGQAMMNWCCGNAKIEPRGNAVIITKQAAGTAKIDPLLAALNAVSLLALNPSAKSGIDSWLRSAA